MKQGRYLLLTLLTSSLAACVFPSTSTSTPASSSASTASSSEASSISSSSISSSSLESSSEASSSSESSSTTPRQEGVYDFYCINDFHGCIVEQYNGAYYEAGISKLFGHLKSLKAADPEHVVLLSAGDMYQGTLESNSNYGELITLAMNNAGFDAMAIGNHEFDYGTDHLLHNLEIASFPMLGGNILAYPSDGSTKWNDDILSSTILERGGNRIGIVGMIGEGQTTSIVSTHVQDMTFVNPRNLAIAEATRLREEEGCGLVIYLIHDERDACGNYAMNKSLFDGVFNAHTHQGEDELMGGVPFVQGICNGEAYSHFQITIENNIARCTAHEYIHCDPSWEENAEINAIRDAYIGSQEFQNKANEVAGTITGGSLKSSEGVPNLATRAIYEKYKELHPDLSCAIENSQRASLSGTVTYHDIYKATPFMNRIIIASVTGKDIVTEGNYSYISVYSDSIHAYNRNQYYTIACIDYVLLHQSINKTYNYFSSLNTDFDTKIIAVYDDYPYDITFDYIKNAPNSTVNAVDFSSNNANYSVSYA